MIRKRIKFIMIPHSGMYSRNMASAIIQIVLYREAISHFSVFHISVI